MAEKRPVGRGVFGRGLPGGSPGVLPADPPGTQPDSVADPRTAAVLLDMVSRLQLLEGAAAEARTETRLARSEIEPLRLMVQTVINLLENGQVAQGGRNSIFWEDPQVSFVSDAIDMLREIL